MPREHACVRVCVQVEEAQRKAAEAAAAAIEQQQQLQGQPHSSSQPAGVAPVRRRPQVGWAVSWGGCWGGCWDGYWGCRSPPCCPRWMAAELGTHRCAAVLPPPLPSTLLLLLQGLIIVDD